MISNLDVMIAVGNQAPRIAPRFRDDDTLANQKMFSANIMQERTRKPWNVPKVRVRSNSDQPLGLNGKLKETTVWC